jgi:hypothetical protein
VVLLLSYDVDLGEEKKGELIVGFYINKSNSVYMSNFVTS